MRECDEVVRKEKCKCASEKCARRGFCCECLEHHWENGSFPACMFPGEVREGKPNSVESFIEVYQARGRWW